VIALSNNPFERAAILDGHVAESTEKAMTRNAKRGWTLTADLCEDYFS
jgi:hypothetical protein